jgi:spore coat polysaccharide biosynthesis protein SpsF (cytidylyltransferase family)
VIEAAKVTAIIQARLGSTRLPGKVLLDLGGRPVIDWVVERVAATPEVDEVIVAIPDGPEDDELFAHLDRRGVSVVRGSAADVLSRFGKAASMTSASMLARVTADCPFIDPSVLGRVIAAFRQQPPVDYCSNVLIRTYPIGLDCEVMSKEVLVLADAEAQTLPEREHVTPFFYQQPERFRLRNVEAPAGLNYPQYRLTLDEEPDLALLRRILAKLGSPEPLTLDIGRVIEIMTEDEELRTLNAHVEHRQVAKPADRHS